MSEDQSGAMDPIAEINAMQAISVALKPLDASQINRVLTWANNLFLSKSVPTPTVLEEKPQAPAYDEPDNTTFDELADFYSVISPRSDLNKALVVGYWLQTYGGQQDFDALRVNTELKHLGFKVTNITRALDGLAKTKPQLTVQTRKGGSSRQARKRWKVTFAGAKRVEEMMKEAEIGM